MLQQLPSIMLPIGLALLSLLEWLAPAAPRGAGRWRFAAANLAVGAITFIIAIGLGMLALSLAEAATTQQFGLLQMLALPEWLQIGAGILLIDFVDYWRHRLTHELQVLWRVHRVHHTDPDMDATTALRSHPLDIAVRMAAITAVVPALGIPPLALLLSPVIALSVLLFMHANLALPPALDRALGLFIQTPGLHRSHHSRTQRQTDSNYGTILTIWDRLFGTLLRVPEPGSLRVGLNGWTEPRHHTVAGMMLTPFRR